MDENPLRGVLERVTAGEPPMGSLVQDALQAGRRMRWRHRMVIGTGAVTMVAAVLLVVPGTVAALHRTAPPGVMATTPGPVPASTGMPSPDPWPTAPAAVELSQPTDAFSLTEVQIGQYGLARDILVGTCMRRYGFVYDAAADRAAQEEFTRRDILDMGLYGGARVFGLIDPAAAATVGYHLPSTLDPMSPVDSHGLGPLTTAKEQVLTGSGPKIVNGIAVPERGCVGAADATLAPYSGALSSTFGDQIGLHVQHLIETDHTVAHANAAWVTCMSTKGYHYPSWTRAGTDVDIDTAKPSAKELAEAVADVGCKQSSRLITAIVGVLTTYEAQQIALNPAAVAAAQRANTLLMTKVYAIINAG